MNSLLAIGYTGIAVVFLSAVAYSLRISLDPSAASVPLTVLFLLLNAVGWLWGGRIWARQPGEPLGKTLLVLGDVIFPLNLYAPLFLHVPGFRGRAFQTASAVLLLGVLYHLRNCRRIETSRFDPSFYPYFFASAGAAELYLARFTLGIPLAWSVWLILAFGMAFWGAAASWRLRPERHFFLAVLVLFSAAGTLTAATFLHHPTLTLLLALLVPAPVLCWLAWSARGWGPLSRLFGLGGYWAWTVFFTASLAFLGARAIDFVIATAAWVWALTLLGMVVNEWAAQPFRESAHWLAVALGCGLALCLAPAWLTQAGLGVLSPQVAGLVPPAFGPSGSAGVLAPVILASVSATLVLGSYWRWRYPSIALSSAGFVASASLLRLTSYLGPLLLVAASGGLWAASAGLGSVVAPFLLGSALLLLSSHGEKLGYPRGATDLAGFAAILLSAWNARLSPALAAILLASGSLLFLWRSAREKVLWPHLSFLALGTVAAAVAGLVSEGVGQILPLCALCVALIILCRWLPAWGGGWAKAQATLAWALTTTLAATALAAVQGLVSPWSPVIVWSGMLAWLAWGRRFAAESEQPLEPRTADQAVAASDVDEIHWLAAIGAALLLSLLRRWGVPAIYAAPALAAWSWLHAWAAALLTAREGGPAAARAARHAVHGFAAVSVVLALVLTDASPSIVCLLAYAVLGAQLLGPSPLGWSGLTRAAFVLVLVVIGLETSTPVDLGLATLTGSALIFLWRSVRERSFVPHVVFLVAATGAAVLASVARPAPDLLPPAALSIALLFVARWLQSREGPGAKLRLTQAWAMILGAGALLAALFLNPSPRVFLTLWLGSLAGLAGRERRSGSDRRAAARATPDRRRGMVAEGGTLALVGLSVAHVAGATLVWFLLRAWHAPPAHLALALAGWGWLHLGASLGLESWGASPAMTRSTRQAVHGLAAVSLLLAALYWREGPPSILACAAVGVLYLAARLRWGQAVLEHAAAIGFLEAVFLIGAAYRIVIPDFYLSAVGSYLCLNLYLRFAGNSSQTGRPAAASASRRGLRPVKGDLRPLLISLLTVVYPFWALLRSGLDVHAFFLGGASVIVLYVLLASRQHPVFIYGVCFLFVIGAAYLLTFGDVGERAQLFLALVGSLVITNLVFAGERMRRQLTS